MHALTMHNARPPAGCVSGFSNSIASEEDLPKEEMFYDLLIGKVDLSSYYGSHVGPSHN
jgi:hypothetical protein